MDEQAGSQPLPGPSRFQTLADAFSETPTYGKVDLRGPSIRIACHSECRGRIEGKMSSASTDQRLEHLLTAVENEFQKGSEKGDVTERDIKLSLDDCELWTKFKELTNEMIVTKTGR